MQMLALQHVWAVIPLLPSTFLLCQIQTMHSAGGLPAITAFTRRGRFRTAREGGGAARGKGIHMVGFCSHSPCLR